MLNRTGRWDSVSFSNVAIAAAAARARLECERVLVIDWDVHRGNGTQKALYHRDDILFFSVHQSPLFTLVRDMSRSEEVDRA